MIKSPSLQSEYTLVFSDDPALDLPQHAAGETDEQAKQVDADRTRILHNARLTGNWPILPGQVPTIFHFRNLEASDLTWLDGERESSTEHGRRLSDGEFFVLAIRLALIRIDNFGNHRVEFRPVGSQRKVATSAIINALHREAGAHGPRVISELAGHIIARGNNVLDPL